MSRFRVVIAEDYESAVDRFADIADVIRLSSCDAATLTDALGGADALLVRTYAKVTDQILSAAPKLKVIGRGGVGLDNIDLDSARRRGIVVVHTPAAATQSAAEHTVGLMLALERRLIENDRATRDGRFAEFRKQVRYRELAGLTLGVVGMGRIGSAVARIARDGLGMRILYNDIKPVGPFPFATAIDDKRVLYASADVVTLHVPLTNQTKGLIDADALSCFRPETALINTSRGPVIDLTALANAIQSNQVAGAALDVFDPEPPPADHPILACPNVVVSAHTAARSAAALARMDDVVDDVIRVLTGQTPQFPG